MTDKIKALVQAVDLIEQVYNSLDGNKPYLDVAISNLDEATRLVRGAIEDIEEYDT